MVAPSSSVAMTSTVSNPSAIGITVHDWPTCPSEQTAPHSNSAGAEGFLVSLSLMSVTENVIGVVTTTSSELDPRVITGGRLMTEIVDSVDDWSLSSSVIRTETAKVPSSIQDHSTMQSSSDNSA